jgi:hypothetical protein
MFIRSTALAIPGYTLTSEAWVVEAVLAMAVITVGGIIYVKIKKLAQNKLGPPTPTIPTNSVPVPPIHPNTPPPKTPSRTSELFQPSDSVDFYNIASDGQIMPNFELCSNYLKIDVQHSPCLMGCDWGDMPIEVWWSGHQFVCLWKGEIILGDIIPPNMPIIWLDATDIGGEVQFFRTKK